jgi:hypothetical protein
LYTLPRGMAAMVITAPRVSMIGLKVIMKSR